MLTRQRLLAAAFAVLALTTFAFKNAMTVSVASPLRSTLTAVWYSLSGVMLFTSLLLLLGSFDNRGRSALLRLDWFLPMIRRLSVGQSPSRTLMGRLLRRWLPSFLQSDHATKRRGPFRRFVRRLGPSWIASPVRRVCQGTCLLLFLGLFLYVCWPYHAAPIDEPLPSKGWIFERIDDDTGEVLFALDAPADPDFWSHPGSPVVAVDARASDPIPVAHGVVAGVAGATSDRTELRLSPTGEITDQMIAGLFAGSGEFDLYDRVPNAWPSHYADSLASKEIVPAETFLAIDPLVSLSTAIASRSWVWSLASACAILIVCLLIPRGFCGYLCPLGTTIDLFDWAVAGRTKRFNVPSDGWWVHVKYYLLAGTLVAATCGVLVSGFVSAIPVITRAMLFLVEPLQSSATRGWHLVPAFGWGQFLSIGLFAVVLGLGFLRPRFWCKYVCPSGALFSLGNLFRATERKVESSCIHCNKCVEICPFDAIKPDFTTRTTDCTMCQSCGGVCPTHAIKFVERWNVVELKIADDPPTNETAIGRRGFLSLAAGGTAATVGGVAVATATKAFGANLNDPDSFRPVRPPGSVPEQSFLEMCIRCGECFKACPNNVLQPEGFEQGLEGLWAPLVNADWAGCESSCNACGQVCPTGAIRALPIEEKKVARMGLAIVNESTCLPFAGRQECDLCVQECNAAGYHAIEFTQTGTEVDQNGQPIEGTGFLAPVVLEDQCVGCGLCQTRCYAVNVKSEGLLKESAIIIKAGEGKEDRIMSGSYIELRERESNAVQKPISEMAPIQETSSSSTQEPLGDEAAADDDPFGLGN